MAQHTGKDLQSMALEKLVEARREAVEAIAKGHGQLEKHLSVLTSAQAGIDVLKKAKAEITKSFKNKTTNVTAPKKPEQPYPRPFGEYPED
jgi:hypothetical protein